ncbi:glycosyltransferase [Plantactinospora sp. S1510]|uniref:Glycosyltransferase n=1 Tax=Plantactinospora alkalitolerans TaxID=2789879 RepID=A0ABS0H012_9ACTN|nr:glycosyltransferase [Plantactinospora alkalitolerans]MBF9131797.1 glycosyltransferase [Plantactinospora alkalitolerans]
MSRTDGDSPVPDQLLTPGEGGPVEASAMTVLHVSHTAQPGGAELALVRLLTQQRRHWRARLCAPGNGTAFDGLAAHGVGLERNLPALPTGGTRGGSLLLAARYLRALQAGAGVLARSRLFRDADLVHANTAAAAICSAFADRGGAKPLVVHLRDLVTTDSLGRFGFGAFTRIALGRADGVIANSRTTLTSAERWLRPGLPRMVIQSPVGIDRRVTAPRLGAAVRRIGMVGRLQRWKGQHVFLRAFALAFRGTDVRARIAGAPLFAETAYETEIRRLVAELGIADQVDLLGHVDDVPGFLDSVDILVHASTRPEPLGQTVIQGLARALPIVATEGGGPGEWIRSGVNGLLVPPNDPEALGGALLRLADSAELRAGLAAGAAATPGIRTDEECQAHHAGFFRAVWQARRDAGGK